MVETCWLPLETLTSGLASWEFATPSPACLLDVKGRAEVTDVRVAGLLAYGQRLLALWTSGSLTACINPVKAKFDNLI